MNDENILLDMLYLANREMLKEDIANIKYDVSERNLCASLMAKLKELIRESKFANYYVDVEYNRNFGEVKTIIDDDYNIIQITPDLIIHSRGENVSQDNLLAFEMKKSSATLTEKEKDKKRLRIMTRDSYDNVWCIDDGVLPKHVCGYKIGIYYEIDNIREKILFEVYHKGKLWNRFNHTFIECLNYNSTNFVKE